MYGEQTDKYCIHDYCWTGCRVGSRTGVERVGRESRRERGVKRMRERDRRGEK